MSAPAVTAATAAGTARSAPGAAAALAGAAVLAQVTYPLLSGDGLRTATVLAVVLFAAASTAHAVGAAGARGALTVAVAGGVGWAAEAAGVSTGLPFGRYAYAGTLGPMLLDVPVLVPLAWAMMAYPCLLLGRRLASRRPAGRRRAATALTGGSALAAWDLFLDPQMVAAGHWAWADPEPALPGVPGVPLTNYAGWVLVAVTLVAVLDRVLPRAMATGATGATGEAVPAALLAWTWLGSTVGNLVFFGRPWVALYGFVAMGALVGPYLLAAAPGRRGDRRQGDRRQGG